MRVIAKVMKISGIITLEVRSPADRHFGEEASSDTAKHKHSASIRGRHVALPLNFPRIEHLTSEIRLCVPNTVSTYDIAVNTRVGCDKLFLVTPMYLAPPPIPGRGPRSQKPIETLLLFLELCSFVVQPALQIQLCHQVLQVRVVAVRRTR